MNDFISISPAKNSESKLLAVLFKTVYINTYGTEGVTDEFANFIEKQFAPTKIENDFENGHSSLWVAKYNNNPVGVLQIVYKNPCPVTNKLLPEINKLYILTHFSGKGIGQKLMKVAEQELIQNGHKVVWLWVLDTNKRAIDFYGKQGYKNIGKADFQMEVNSYKNIVMQKEL